MHPKEDEYLQVFPVPLPQGAGAGAHSECVNELEC